MASLDFHLHVTTANISSLYLINALDIYLILGVQVGVTISTKLIHFLQKYQESLNIAEFPLYQLIHKGRLEIHITL